MDRMEAKSWGVTVLVARIQGRPKKGRQHAHAQTDAGAMPCYRHSIAQYPPAETSYHPTARSAMSDEESYEYEYE